MELTPSELVLLGADEIFKTSSHSSEGTSVLVPGKGVRVVAEQLGLRMAVAAVLAVEEAGVIELRPKQWTRLLPLDWGKTLQAIPGGGFPAWPPGSLEGALCRAARSSPVEIGRFFIKWLPSMTNPWVGLIERVAVHLEERGVLEIEKKGLLGLFRETTFRLAQPQPLPDWPGNLKTVVDMLDRCEASRPELLDLLCRRVMAGVACQTVDPAPG